jgi:hypothetical protein
MGAEHLDFTGIRSPGRPARSESLHRLSYTGPQNTERYKGKLYRRYKKSIFVMFCVEVKTCTAIKNMIYGTIVSVKRMDGYQLQI